MKTQISRDAFRPERRESGVYQQQGRMLTDADWNLLAEIVKRRLDEALDDMVGSGAPREGGLRVKDRAGLLEGSRLYAGGVPARVVKARPADPFTYANQADFPGPPALPADSFTFYADVWERTVVSLEDAEIWVPDDLRDPALHGADTTTRTQTMAQIKWCPRTVHPEDPAANPPLGDAQLTVTLRAGTAGADPCDPCAAEVAIARRVGNYLFRLEVHDVVVPAAGEIEVTLKWSSENGAEQHRLGTEPPDFKVGDFVYELYNDATEKHLGVHLAPGFPPARARLEESFPASPPPEFDRVRRWDGYAGLKRAADGAWSLVRGKERELRLRATPTGTDPGDVRLVPPANLVFHLKALDLDLLVGQGPVAHRFIAGDYWLAPVRESVHKSGDRLLAGAPPVGIVHHALRLAGVDAAGNLEGPDPDRPQRLEFPPLTDLGLPASKVTFAKPCETSLYKDVPPASIKTVADALTLLCNIQADDVLYKGPGGSGCASPTIQTVKDALDNLCQRTSGAGCRVTVGPEGRYLTIKDAIEDLLRGPGPIFDICLCLLPGDHSLVGGFTLVPAGREIHLSLCGCGPVSRLRLSDQALDLTGARSLHIADLALKIEPQAKLVAKQCGDIVLERLVVTGPGREPFGVGAIDLQAETSVRVAASRFRFADTKFLAGPVDTLESLLTPINSDLGGLFSAGVDDDKFPERKTRVARILIALDHGPRDEIKRKIEPLISGEAPPLDQLNISEHLSQFISVLGAEGQPAEAAVAGTLAKVREAALEALPSVVLSLSTASGDTTLVDNKILGTVSVYGGTRTPTEADLTEPQLQRLAGALKNGIPQSKPGTVQFIPAGRLEVARNEMSRLVVGRESLTLLKNLAGKPPFPTTPPRGQVLAYRIAFVGQNRFSTDEISVMAKDICFTDNLFDLLPNFKAVGWAFVENCTYVGNRSRTLFQFTVPGFLNASFGLNRTNLDDLNEVPIKDL